MFCIFIALGAVYAILYMIVRACIDERERPQHLSWHRRQFARSTSTRNTASGQTFNRYCTTGDLVEPADGQPGKGARGAESPHRDPFGAEYAYTCDCPDDEPDNYALCPHR